MVDVNMEFSIPLAEKIVNVVANAIGQLYEPIHIRRIADAKCHEISALCKALRENPDISIAYDRGGIKLNTDVEFINRATQRMLYQELIKQGNIESIIAKACEISKNDTYDADRPVEQDWLFRFVNSAQDISNTDMQMLWAKILAGEVKRPSTYSMRTLEALRNITRDEALLFQEICNYIINDGKEKYLPAYKQLHKEVDISCDNLLKIQECGLINTNLGICINKKLYPAVVNHIARNNSYIILAMSDLQQELGIQAFPLTSIGYEISNLFESNIEDDYLIAFAKEIKLISSSVKVTLHEILEINDGKVKYNTTDLLSDQ